MGNSDLNVIQKYIQDINSVLRDSSSEDILIIFRKLYDKEQSFVKKMQSTAYGKKIYISFIERIVKARGGIKSARSYFRARQESYLNTVNKAIREVKPEFMYNVPVNYRFCLFVMETLENQHQKAKLKNKKIPKKKIFIELEQLFVEIKSLREEIINKHLYLSLHKAKVFSKNAYGSHSEFEDLIQIANEGLVVAADKYVMDNDSSSFHSMAIGRILANLIANGSVLSSATVGLHAQKKLYQIRKLLQSNPNFNSKDLSESLSIAEEEINDLLAATSYKSFDDTISDDGETRLVDVFKSDKEEEDQVEKKNLMVVVNDSFSVLSIIERKVLALRGVKIYQENK